MAALTGIQVALRNQITRELWDYANKKHCFIGLLAAFDNMYGVNTRFTKSSDTSGEKIQVDFRATLPTVAGVNAVSGALGTLALSAQTNYSIVSGTTPWSHYHGREDVRKALVSKLEKDPKAALPYMKKIAESMSEAMMKKLQEDMFPAENFQPTLAGGSGGIAGDAAENKILGVGYPLQGGYAGNATTGAGTYNYLDIDLNTTTSLKAVQSGDSVTAFGSPTLSNIRRKLRQPLRQRGATPDLGLCDTRAYDYILSVPEAAVVLQQDGRLEYGGELAKIGGVWWVNEDRLDQLDEAGSASYSEMYMLDTATWEFRLNDKELNISFFQTPDAPSLMTMLSYVECALVCQHPRYNAHAFNITYS